MKPEAPDYIRSIKPYVPGKPIEELEREYGISGSIKLASNENPLGPSPRATAAMSTAMANLHRYPDVSGYSLVRKLAEKLALSQDQVVLGNGSDDVIGMLTRAYLKPGDEAVMTAPSFLMYEIFVRTVGATPVFVPLVDLAVDLSAMLEKMSSRTRMVFINNPHNPTGAFIQKDEFADFMFRLPDQVVVVLDEAYIDFVTDPRCVDGMAWVAEDRPLAVLRTFSKAYGLAGIRIGYGVMPACMASLLNRIRQPFNTNLLAQAGALAALDDDEFLEKTKAAVQEGLAVIQSGLTRMGVRWFPTQTNFLLIDVKQDADAFFKSMLKKGVIVRSMVSYGYPRYIRVNAGLPAENARFLEAFSEVMKQSKKGGA